MKQWYEKRKTTTNCKPTNNKVNNKTNKFLKQNKTKQNKNERYANNNEKIHKYTHSHIQKNLKIKKRIIYV